MDKKVLLEWKTSNTKVYTRFKQDLERQLSKPYHQTILDLGDGNAEPLCSAIASFTAITSEDSFDIDKLYSKAVENCDESAYCLCCYLLFDNGADQLTKALVEKAEESGTQEIMDAVGKYKSFYNRNKHQEAAEITSEELNLLSLRRWHYDHPEEYAEFIATFQKAYNGDMTFLQNNMFFLMEMLSFKGVKGMMKIVASLFPGNKHYEQGLMDTDDNPLMNKLAKVLDSSLNNNVIRERLLHKNPYLLSLYYWIIFENGFLHAADLISQNFLTADSPNWQKMLGRKTIVSLIEASIGKAHYSKTQWKEITKKVNKGEAKQVIKEALLEVKGHRGRKRTMILLEEMLPAESVTILTSAIEKELSEWKRIEETDTIQAYIFAALVKGELTNGKYNYRTFHAAMREKFPDYHINEGFDWAEATYNAIMSENNGGNLDISEDQIQRGKNLADNIRIRFLSSINPNIK